MKYYIVLLFCLIGNGCQNKGSQEDLMDIAAKAVIEPFLSSLKGENVESSLENLLANNKNIQLEDSTTLDLKRKFIELHQKSGGYSSFRLVKKKKIGTDVAIYSYLIKYSAKFYRFIFVFYNNDRSVRLYKFAFDDNIDIEMEESLKYYVD